MTNKVNIALREERDYLEAEVLRLREILKPSNKEDWEKFKLTRAQGALYERLKTGRTIPSESLESAVEIELGAPISTRTLYVHMTKLRQKLGPDFRIVNVRQIGYRMENISKQ